MLYKISFFVPETDVENVKQAMFAQGAGRIGDYDQCSWQTLGTGQFRPLEGSQPVIGSQDRLEQVQELKVEMVCESGIVRSVVKALIASHPYEEPAYDVIQVLTLEDLPE